MGDDSPPKPIQMLWVSGNLPWYAIASINSFLHHGHEVVLYAYDAPTNLPKGCAVEDAAQILARRCVFTYRDGHHQGHLSGFSNWFRYALLVRHGGWWSDCDVICVRPFRDGGDEFVFAAEFQGENPLSVNANVIYCRDPDSAVMLDCLAYCEQKKVDIQHAETGPRLLNDRVRKYGLKAHIRHPENFNPVAWNDTGLFFRSPLYVKAVRLSRRLRKLRPVSLSRRTEGVHLYASVLTDCGRQMTMSGDIPRGSLLSQLIEVHCPPWTAMGRA